MVLAPITGILVVRLMVVVIMRTALAIGQFSIRLAQFAMPRRRIGIARTAFYLAAIADRLLGILH
jgi:hypothetical protein